MVRPRVSASPPDALVAAGLDQDTKLIVDERGKIGESWSGAWARASSSARPKHHNLKNTKAKVKRGSGIVSNALRAYANGRRDNCDLHLTLDVYPHALPHLPRRASAAPNPAAQSVNDRTAGESPARYEHRMQTGGARDAQAERKAKLDAGRSDTVIENGERALLPQCCRPRNRRYW